MLLGLMLSPELKFGLAESHMRSSADHCSCQGVQEHAFFFKSIADAHNLRQRVCECFERAALPTIPEQVSPLLHWLVSPGRHPLEGFHFTVQPFSFLVALLPKITRMHQGLLGMH